jgi:hypothetical protein
VNSNLVRLNQGLANPLLPADLLREAVPGNIRRGEHFLAFLRRLLDYLQLRLNTNQVRAEASQRTCCVFWVGSTLSAWRLVAWCTRADGRHTHAGGE